MQNLRLFTHAFQLLAIAIGILVDVAGDGLPNGTATSIGLLAAVLANQLNAEATRSSAIEMTESLRTRVEELRHANADGFFLEWEKRLVSKRYKRPSRSQYFDVLGQTDASQFFMEAALAARSSWSCTCDLGLVASGGTWFTNVFAYQNAVSLSSDKQNVNRLLMADPENVNDLQKKLSDFKNLYDHICHRALGVDEGAEWRRELKEHFGTDDVAVVDTTYLLGFFYDDNCNLEKIRCYHAAEKVQQAQALVGRLWGIASPDSTMSGH